MPKMATQAEYERDAQRVAAAIKRWIAKESATRLVDLKFHKWGTTAYIGPLSGRCIDYLAASPDARAMLEWVDEQTGHQATLMMACCVLELLEIKPLEHTCGKAN